MDIQVENSGNMKESVSLVRQMQLECEDWKKRLELLVHENVQLKTYLAKMVKENGSGADLVEIAEQFQSQFMLEDDIISLVRRDVAVLERLLSKYMYDNKSIFKELLRKHGRLRRELGKIEKDFNMLKRRFHVFMEEA
jgi:hypothetical protein